jgi:predicted HTH transcriptional regulator
LFAILPKDVLAELIAGGESDQVEFKSMANKGLDGVLQEVAAFLNLDGGQLFIGIENTTPHAAVNLEMSYKEVGVSNSDQFQRHLLEKFYSSLDENFYHSDIKIEFPTYMNQKICHIKIRRGERPVHLKQNGKKCFYVRIGNSKRELLPGKVQQYCKQRWPEE